MSDASVSRRMKRPVGLTLVAALFLVLATIVTVPTIAAWDTLIKQMCHLELCSPLPIVWLYFATLSAIGLSLATFGLFGCRLWARRVALGALSATFGFFGALLYLYLSSSSIALHPTLLRPLALYATIAILCTTLLAFTLSRPTIAVVFGRR